MPPFAYAEGHAGVSSVSSNRSRVDNSMLNLLHTQKSGNQSEFNFLNIISYGTWQKMGELNMRET